MRSALVIFTTILLGSVTPPFARDVDADSANSVAQPTERGATLMTLERIAAIAFGGSRVVMVNEPHDGRLRHVRSRLNGARMLRTAHRLGCRHLAIECLPPELEAEINRTRALPVGTYDELGYLAHAEMRTLIDAALQLGWTLHSYEADFSRAPVGQSRFSRVFVNWREAEQANHLASIVNRLPDHEKMLVWCGNGHHSKRPTGELVMMGRRFLEKTGLEPFCVVQGVTIQHVPDDVQPTILLRRYGSKLRGFGGTAAVLCEDEPILRDSWFDAAVLTVENTME